MEGKRIERARTTPRTTGLVGSSTPLHGVDSTLMTSNDSEIPTCYLGRAPRIAMGNAEKEAN